MAHFRLCSIPDCGKRHSARGLCRAHYSWWKRNSRPYACSVTGCAKSADRLGFCTAHYMRARRNGGNPIGGRLPPNTIARFVTEVALPFRGPGCLDWPFTRTKAGYATGKIDGKFRNMSRYICIETHGDPPSNAHQAAHICGNGNRGCVNPHHLTWKTRRENEADKVTHGTKMIGEGHPQSKLTVLAVLDIRQQEGKMSSSALAGKYGVARDHIRQIQLRKSWAWMA